MYILWARKKCPCKLGWVGEEFLADIGPVYGPISDRNSIPACARGEKNNVYDIITLIMVMH